MPITRPTIPVAEKGAPITAEAWNAMRAAILNLYDLLDAKPVTGRIKVSVAGKGREALPGALVVAVRKDDSAIRKEAVLQGDTFVLDELPEATWLVTASAAGYVAETTTAIVTAGETETLALALAKQEATVVMPQVKESDLAGAIGALKAKGLANVKAEDEFGKYVSTQDPGLYQTAKVTEQKPASGEVVPVSRTIELRVQAMRQMPALKGGKLAEALDAVIKSGLAVAAISLEGGGNLDRNDVPAHYYGAEVLEQSPAAGAVPAAQPVTLHVRAMRVMPDLAGKMKLQDALSALTAAGLGLKEITISGGGTVNPAQLPDQYKGALVMTQSPAAGAVRADTKVSLQVQAMGVMPDVAYKLNLGAALAAIGNLPVESIRDTQDKPIDPKAVPAHYTGAQVVQQTPAPGPVEAGTKVTFKVQAMRSMPQLARTLNLKDALAALGDLPVQTLKDNRGVALDRNNLPAHYQGAPVVEQSPAAGPVVAGTNVTLIVAAMRNMPNVVGRGLNDALAAVGDLTVAAVADTRGARWARNQVPGHYGGAAVTAQAPAAGAVQADTQVTLTVNATVVVPEFRNISLADASKRFPEGVAFTTIRNNLNEAFGPGNVPGHYWPGRVTHQEPGPGTAAPFGVGVTLHQTMVQVPALNANWATAQQQLAQVGLLAASDHDPGDIEDGNGEWVFSGQTPAAGTWLPQGTTVTWKTRWKRRGPIGKDLDDANIPGKKGGIKQRELE